MLLPARVFRLQSAYIESMSFLQVLLRSSHQGCKVDVWSAGVTLLYFIIGKAPFGGDPEQ